MINPNKGTILFRVEIGQGIGAGHAMRCLALAEALTERGFTALFLCHLAGIDRPGPMIERRFEAAGIRWHRIDPAAGDLTHGHDAAALVIDGYRVRPDQWRTARVRGTARGMALVSFEDCLPLDIGGGGAGVPVDLVVNPGADPRDALRRPAGCLWLFGPDYVMVRGDLRQAACQPPWPMALRDRILVGFGGSDPMGLTVPVVAGLIAAMAGEIAIHAVVGGLVPDAARVMATLGAMGPAVRAEQDPVALARLMQESGLAVAAAGGMVGELAALSVPSLVAIVADNQVAGAMKAAAGGLIRAVDVRGQDPTGAAALLVAAAVPLWRDGALRAAMAAKASGLIDPAGAGRVADALIGVIGDMAAKRPGSSSFR